MRERIRGRWVSGDQEGAIRLAEEAVEEAEPRDRAAVATLLTELAPLAERPEAEKSLQLAVRIRQGLRPPDHPTQVMSPWPLVEALVGWDDVDAAEERMEAEIDACAPRPEMELSVCVLLGGALERGGHLERAEAWTRRALQLPLHDRELTSPLQRLQRLLDNDGRHREAAEVAMRSLRASSTVDSAPTVDDASMMSEAAQAWLKAGEARNALALARRGRALSLSNPMVVGALALDEAEALSRLGESPSEAVADAERILAGCGGAIVRRLGRLKERVE